jgi:hypothetical protein
MKNIIITTIAITLTTGVFIAFTHLIGFEFTVCLGISSIYCRVLEK